MTLQELIVKIGSDVSGYVSGIDQAISKGEAAKASFASIGTTLSATLTVPLTAIGGAALKAASDLKEASNIMRVETGKTGDALAGLNDSFKTVFAAVPTSSKSAADAIATLSTRLGLAGKPLEDLTTQLLELARITGSDVKPMVETTAKMFNEWQIATSKQSDALDYLLKVTQTSNIGFAKLEGELTDFFPTLKNLGFSFQDAALLLGQLDKAGVEASSVMPGLKKEFATLAKAGIDGADAFNKIVAGIKNGSISLKQALDIFGQKSGGAIFREIIEGKFGLNDMKAATNANIDTVHKAAQDTMTMSLEMQQAWNQVELSLQPLGDVLKKAFKDGFEATKPLLGIIHDLGEEFKALPPKTQNIIVAIGGIAAAIGPAAFAISGLQKALGAIGGVGSGIGSGVSNSFTALAAAVKNISFAVQNDLVGGLSRGELALLRFGQAAAIAGAAFVAFDQLRELEGHLVYQAQLLDKFAPAFGEYAAEAKKALHDAIVQAVPDAVEALNRLADEFPEVYRAAAKAKDNVVGSMQDMAKGIKEALSENSWEHFKDEVKSSYGPIAELNKGFRDLKKLENDFSTDIGHMFSDVAKKNQQDFQASLGVTIAQLEKAAGLRGITIPTGGSPAGEATANGPIAPKTPPPGGGGTFDFSALNKGILTLDQLIKKQAELEAAVKTAQAAFASVNKTYGETGRLTDLVIKAEEQLAKAYKEAGNVVGEITTTLDLHNRKAEAAELVLDKLRENYGYTAKGVVALAEAHKLLDGEIAAGNGGIQTAAQLVADLADKFEIQKAKAENAIVAIDAIRTAYGNTEIGVRLLAEAHKQLDGAISALDPTYAQSSQVLKDYAAAATLARQKVEEGVAAGTKSYGDLVRAQDAEIEANQKVRDSLTPVAEAFKTLGVTSTVAMADTLAKYQRAYNLIGQDGKQSATDVMLAYRALHAEMDNYADAINPVEQAFKTLGLTSTEHLRKMADTFHEALNTIRNDGTQGWGAVQAAEQRAEEADQKYQDALHGTTTAITAMGPATEAVGHTMITAFEAVRQKVITVFDTTASAIAKIRAAAGALPNSVGGTYDTGTLSQSLHGASGKDWQDTMSTGSLPLAGPGVAGWALTGSGIHPQLTYYPDGLPQFSGSDKSTPTDTSGSTTSTPTVVPATPATLTQTTIDQLIMVLENLNSTLSDLAKAISGGVGVSSNITAAANQATGTLTTSAGQTSTALNTLQSGLTSTGTAAANAIGSLTTSVGDMTGAIDKAFEWAKNQLLGQGYTEAQIDAVAAQAKEIVSKIDFSQGVDAVISQLQSILQSLGVGGDAVNALILQMKDQFGGQFTPALQDGTSAVQDFTSALTTSASSLGQSVSSQSQAIQAELQKMLASGMSFENAVSALGGTIQNGQAIFSDLNSAFANLGDSANQAAQTFSGITETGGDFAGAPGQTLNPFGANQVGMYQDSPIQQKGMWEPQGGPQMQIFSYDQHIPAGWGNYIQTNFLDPGSAGGYQDQGSGGTGKGLTGGIPTNPYQPALPPLDSEWSPISATPHRAFNASDYLPTTPTNGYLPAPGALAAPTQVVINNPTVLNRSMLDMMTQQIQNLGLGR